MPLEAVLSPYGTPGSWHWIRRIRRPNVVNPGSSHILMFTCPRCGIVGSVDWTYHKVDEEGKLTPALRCPGDGCLFEEEIILVGWKAREGAPK